MKMTIYEKLSAVQQELKAPKNRRNTFGKYNYRSCEDILEAVKPILAKHEATILITDDISEVGGKVYIQATVRFVDLRVNGDMITVNAFARESVDKKGMDDAQITGTSSSYARKYALNGLFLIDDVKDPDSDEYKEETDQKIKASTKKPKDSVLDEYVNAGQLETLNMLLKKAEITEDKFREIYNIATMPEFPANKYEDAVKKLEAAIKAKKGDK